MELAQAQKTADSALGRFRPYCSQIEIAGSVRRARRFVNDIDIVLIPTDRNAVGRVLMEMAVESTGSPKPEMAGPKIARVMHQGIRLDIYYATPETFATLLLIRTGSKRHNAHLAGRAKEKGWRLAASGDGLFDADDQRLAGDTEASIFEALGLPYKEPGKRE